MAFIRPTTTSTLRSEYADSQPGSRFMRLPGEIRNQVLRLVVTQSEPIALRRLEAPFRIDLNVLYTCKQLREEAEFFLHNANTIEVDIEYHGKRTYLHFSKRHTICEYHTTSFEEVAETFFAKFSHFQFRFIHIRGLDSLRRVIAYARDHLHDKHVTVVLPQAARSERTAQLQQVRKFQRLSSYLSPFSLIRCKSFYVIDDETQRQSRDHEKLVSLVTSNLPVLDMAREYEKRTQAMRSLGHGPWPADMSPEEFESLESTLLHHLRQMCDSADGSDQEEFVRGSCEFDKCYRELIRHDPLLDRLGEI